MDSDGTNTHNGSKEEQTVRPPWKLWLPAGIAALIFALLLGVSYAVLIGIFGLSAESLFVRSGGGIATAFAAAIATFLLYYRWTIEHPIQVIQEQKRLDAQDKIEQKRLDAQEKQERERLDAQARLHRQQQRGTRQESLGERMAKAIDHLGEDNSYIQVAGLIELATLVDDWWSLGQEMLDDLDSESVEQNRTRIEGLVQRRRQELVDLIFKNTPTPGEPTDERTKMLREARSQILSSHLVTALEGTEVPNDPDSWRHLNFDRAHLRDAHLEDKYLNGTHLNGANLDRAHLNGAHLTGSHLTGAGLNDSSLQGAHLTGANLDWAHMKKADLKNAHLENATLFSANLDGATLKNTHLNEANLSLAFLKRAKLGGANLTGTELLWASLERADLRTEHLDEHYTGSPSFDKKTQWPDDYDPIKSGFVLDDEEDY